MAISNEKVEVTGMYCNERYVNVALFSKMRNWNTSTGTPGSCSDSRDGHEVTGRESAESVETLDKGPSHVLVPDNRVFNLRYITYYLCGFGEVT